MAHDGERTNDALRLHLLVLRCQTGDERAFARLYDRFHDRTLRYLHGLLGERGAEDVQQEVWLAVYRKIATLTDPGRFRTWLYQVTRHRAIDHLRRQRRHVELLREAADEDVLPPFSEADPVLPIGPAELNAAMAGLSAAHRDVLLLRYWEEMNYAEIALVVGCSVGTVRSRLHYAKHALKHALEASAS